MLKSRLPKAFVREEYNQRKEEGCVIPESLTIRYESLPGEATHEGWEVYAALTELCVPPEIEVNEPSDIEGIKAARPQSTVHTSYNLDDEILFNKIHGAWLGRCAGCLVGKPIEGWPMEDIKQYCEAVDTYPLRTYFPPNEKGAETNRQVTDINTTRGHINRMERDDDTDYTVMNLIILEKFGLDFTPEQVAKKWLHHFAYTRIHTAERVAYRNFALDIWPPESAITVNPWRELIGALIRADVFGYVAPGFPEVAADMAFKDASISHVKNGIYGEMFTSALISYAFVVDDLLTAIQGALEMIPAKCRLAEAVRFSIDLSQQNLSLQDKVRKILDKYGFYSGAHTIHNACIDIIALLGCENNFTKGITDAVMCGLDADCNGATVGSVLGAFLGVDAIEGKWADPLNDTLETFILDYPKLTISGAAERTFNIAKTVIERYK